MRESIQLLPRRSSGSPHGRQEQDDGPTTARQGRRSRVWATVCVMPIDVYDYRANLSNLVVQPQIRSRFRRVELGPVPEVHSHDLGGETFLVMEGEIEFTVDGERVVCTAGQGIFVPPRTTHAVRALGGRAAGMYLSGSPHVEPAHTFYDGGCPSAAPPSRGRGP